MLKTKMRKWCLLLLLLGCSMGVQAQYSMGNTGLLNIPTADMQEAGTFMGGGNYLPNGMTPFNFNTGNYFVNITFLSFLELSYRCTLLKTTRYDGKKGYFQQDRSLSARIRPIKEGKYHPAIVIGTNDPFKDTGTNYFATIYGVLTKGFSSTDCRILPATEQTQYTRRSFRRHQLLPCFLPGNDCHGRI